MSNRVVVLIIAHKKLLEWYEVIALRQCFKVLDRHPIHLVCPEGLDVGAYRAIASNLVVDYIPSNWQSSYQNFNRLKILPFLYRRYSQFEFILFYELDAFVFRDELIEWCNEGWDFVGAPWFEGYHLAMPDARPCGAGNGGFSLRRTSAMLRASRTWRYQQPASEVLQEWRQGKRSLKSAIGAFTFRNNFFAPFNNYMGQEDIFWCQVAARRFPAFRLAPHEVASRFSFEVNPSRLFREFGERLPFGCHKWMFFELQFWKTHIQSLGYELPEQCVAV